MLAAFRASGRLAIPFFMRCKTKREVCFNDDVSYFYVIQLHNLWLCKQEVISFPVACDLKCVSCSPLNPSNRNSTSHLLVWSVPLPQLRNLAHNMLIVRSTLIVNMNKTSFHFLPTLNLILQFHTQIVTLE